ncbi:MAG: hypothetical protein U0136_03315 [Bdellovibrionota bacterium]
MTDRRAHDIWQKILNAQEEKLQYGFLDQAKSVVDIKMDGNELTLFVASDEALRFFTSEVNQQRLFIVSRPIATIEKFRVVKIDSSPLETS